MGRAATVELTVTGMHCSSCGLLIDDALEELDGVVRSDTDSRRGRTLVQADLDITSVNELVSAIAGVGYQATPAPHTEEDKQRGT